MSPLSRREALRAVSAVGGVGSLTPASTSGVPPWAATTEVRAMTRNLGLGAGLFQLLADDEIDPALVHAKYREVLDSGVPVRMAAIAREINRERPVAVAIQEAATISRGPAAGEPTEPVAMFLTQIQSALGEYDAAYRVAATVENASVRLPADPPDGDPFTVGFVDRDALLVGEDVAVEGTAADNYDVNARTTVGGRTLTATRGYCLAAIRVDGVAATAVSTHLASSSPTVRRAQAAELLDALADRHGVTVLMGDFNSGPATGDISAYASLADGFTDASATGDGVGPTCCQLPTLHNVASRLDRRLDAVFVRGPVEPLATRRTGETPGARVDVGGRRLWPSDHAGVVVDLRITPSLDDPREVVRALL